MPLLRDAALATEFVNSLKKVGPSLGMTVGNPKEFKLTDNRPATYVQTLDQVIKMGPSIVMVVIPNNKVFEEIEFEIFSILFSLFREIITRQSRRSASSSSPLPASASPPRC